jgi:hypothetical protein
VAKPQLTRQTKEFTTERVNEANDCIVLDESVVLTNYNTNVKVLCNYDGAQANLTQLSDDLNADPILKSPDMIVSEFNNHKSKFPLSLECLNFLPLIEVPMLPMKDKLSDVGRPAVCCDLEKCLENDFHLPCLGTEIFLRELTLTLSNSHSSNPKSSRSIDLGPVV